MKAYLDLLSKILRDGEYRPDRTGTGTLSLFGESLRVDLGEGFPLLTTKRVHLRSVFYELLWFLRGDTNLSFLRENGVTIWDEWADERGELGPIYGRQWRDFLGVDQIRQLEEGLRRDPFSRRHLVTAWNPAKLSEMALPPCHVLFQVYVSTSGRMSLKLYQRSADVFLGVPFNIASYAALLTMLCHSQGYEPGILEITFGDLHLYRNHVDQARLQLSRESRPLPTLVLLGERKQSITEYRYEDFVIESYAPHPPIKADVAV